MRTRFGVLVASLAAAIAYPPARAHACSCAVGHVDVNPSNSEAAVARNRAIVLSGNLDPDTLVLEKLDGAAHPFEVRGFQHKGPCGDRWSIEMIPTPALDPDTHYELRVLKRRQEGVTDFPPETFVSRFSTSSELLPDPELEPPSGRVLVADAPPNQSSSCGPFDGAGCFQVDDPNSIEMVMRDGDTILEQSLLSQREGRFIVWRMPTCIDLRRRASTGRRSPPLSICGDDLRKVVRGGERCGGDVFGGGSTGSSEPEEAPPPRAAGAAGGRATFPPRSDDDAQPLPADSEGEHREYGCTARGAGSGRSGPPGALGVLALFAVAALRRRSR